MVEWDAVGSPAAKHIVHDLPGRSERRPGGMVSVRTVVSLLLGVVLLSGCAEIVTQPLAFDAPPWQDGEVSEYDVLGTGDAVVGTASWTWHGVPEGWTLAYTLTVGSREDSASVTLGPDLFPLRSWLTHPAAHHEATYAPDGVTIVTVAEDGTSTTSELSRPAAPIDNSQSLQTQRALPLAEGYLTEYSNVVPSARVAVRTQVRVVGAETITVAGGTFDTWRVEMRSGQTRHDAWYAREAPYLLIKYHNRSAGSQMQLRRWRLSAGAAWQGGPPDASQVPLPLADVKPDCGLVAVAFLIQYPLMILFPLLLGWQFRQRLGAGWVIFGAGALTFIASQVVHLPLNWALGLLGGGRGVALWPLPWVALVAGLSAGLCETLARWAALRFWLRRTRGWAEALQLGAGHGGIEAMVLGLLALLGMVSMLAATAAGQSLPETAFYWQSPWYVFVLAGLERVFALTFHIAMSVLVMRAVQRRRVGYLVAGIAAHTAMDAWAVWAMPTFGMVWTEAGLGVMALVALALILRLKPAREHGAAAGE